MSEQDVLEQIRRAAWDGVSRDHAVADQALVKIHTLANEALQARASADSDGKRNDAEPVGYVTKLNTTSGLGFATHTGAPIEVGDPLYQHPAKPESVGVPEGFKIQRHSKYPGIAIKTDDGGFYVTQPDGDRIAELLLHRLADSLADLHPAQAREQWVKCSDRLPTIEDQDCNGDVWACKGPGHFPVLMGQWLILHHEDALWMPTGLKRPNPPQPQSSGEEDSRGR